MINGVLDEVQCTVNSVGPGTCPVVISPVSECIIGIVTLRSWQNSHTSSLICGVRGLLWLERLKGSLYSCLCQGK